MDERKFRILQAIINDYILTAVPVGSRTISKKYETALSSATIRNEMSDLEELGYLDQPHVSAGRIPSAKAYRLYVDHLLEIGAISSSGAADLQRYFAGRMRRMDDAIDRAAQVLSELTQYTAVVTAPGGRQPRLRTIQLVPVSATSALVIIVTDAGVIRDSVIRISDQLDSDTLYAISRELTEKLAGTPLNEASGKLQQLAANLRQGHAQTAELIRDLDGTMAHASQGKTRHVAIGGPSNLLAYPEYSDIEKARTFLSLLEARDRLAEIIQQNGEMAFTVRIGPETGVPEMRDCSIVTATYSTNSGQQGTIGVIGPTRMRYGTVLNILASMGSQLSTLFSEDDPGQEGSKP